jgi:hypothetical protein
MKKSVLVVGLLSVMTLALAGQDEVYFAHDKSTTSDSVPDLRGLDDPVVFVGNTSTPGSDAYNDRLGTRRAVWTARKSGALYPSVVSLGETYATGNQAFDRRVDIVSPYGWCNTINAHFPCTSAYGLSYMFNIPQEARVGN